MKTLLTSLALLALAPVSARAADDGVIAAVRNADVERVAATQAGDGARLGAVLSDSLRYVHSSGHVDTKASYIQELTSHAMVYVTYDYKEQTFTPISPDVVLMAGHAIIGMKDGASTKPLDLNFLAVWRNEAGAWRMIAWQSSRIPQPAK